MKIIKVNKLNNKLNNKIYLQLLEVVAKRFYNKMNKKMIKTDIANQYNVKEGFDGIRKDNSKIIFYSLLSFIILDSIYCIFIEK